jgi:hypothetical protein
MPATYTVPKTMAAEPTIYSDWNTYLRDNILYFKAQLGAFGWQPDKPPTTAGSIDDEFNDASLSGNWTEYDPEGKTTWTEGNGGAKAVTATTAADNVNGLYRSLPAGDFSVWTKVSISFTDTNTWLIGIGLWENPAGNNKMFAYYHIRDISTLVARVGAYDYTNHTTVSTTKMAAITVGYSDFIYLRLRRNGTNYYIDHSFGGTGWRTPNAAAAITLTYTPTAVGLVVDNVNTGVNATAYAQFFRYVASDMTLAGMMAGNI